MHVLSARPASLGSLSRFTRQPFLPPPARGSCHRVRRAVQPASAASGPVAAAEFAKRVLPWSNVTKSGLAKLPVVQLRSECERLGLPTDGLKPEIVERLLGWWQQQQAADQPTAQQAQQAESPQEQHAPALAAAEKSAETRAESAAEAAERPPQGSAQASAAAPGSEGSGQQEGQRPGGGGVVQATWLGTSSGNPTPRRNVSSIAVRFDEDVYLVDAGEGTRNQLRRGELDPAALRAVCVTHMHGDHCFGLGGVVAAVCEARLGTPRQEEELVVYGPPEVQAQLLTAVRAGILQLTSPLLVVGLVLDPARARPPTPAGPSGLLRLALQAPDQAERVPPALAASLQGAYDQGSERVVQPGLTWTLRVPGAPAVTAAQLQHRVPCWGYVFREAPQPAAPPRSPRAAAAPSHGGEEEGPGAPPRRWVRPGRKLVILGDTCDSSAIAPLALSCDLLSHEATFCTGMEEKAAVAQHSTTLQAGAFAAAVSARALVLTHFSARYDSLSGLTNRLKKHDERPRGEIRGELSMGDLQRGEMQRLREETRSTYGKDSIYLASDFFTFTVHKRAPVPAEQLAEELAAEAAQAQEVVRAAQAAAQQGPRARRPQQREREWGPRRQQGGGYRQQGGGYRQQGGRPRQGQQQQQQRRRQWAPAPSD